MTFFASNLLMLPGELECRPRVVEFCSRFPGLRAMTAQAIGAELLLVRLLVTRNALAAQAQERLVEVFHLDLRAGCGSDLSGFVALLAALFTMFAFQREACLLAVIEALAVKRDQGKSRPAMFRVTASAVRSAR